MEIAITWLQYALIIVIALTIYYIVLGILYYKKEILNATVKKEKDPLNNSFSLAEASAESEESFDTFFHNQIHDNNYDYNEPENDVNDYEDFDHKAEQDKPVNEVSDTTHPLPEAQTEQNTFHEKYTPSIVQTDDAVQKIEELSSKLTEAIAIAADKNYSKDEFIVSIKDLLQRYQFLKSSPQIRLINILITSECEKYGYIQLSAEEQVMLWNE